MNYTKRGWKKIKENLSKIDELYDKIETRNILLKDDYYKSLYGRSKNRTLIKENPKLYNSIYKHTQNLEDIFIKQKGYFGLYSFTRRITFIVDRNYDIETLRCECGRKYNWTPYCRYCPNPKKTWLGKVHSKETKKKQRIGAINYIKKQKGQIQPRYNVKSISLIEEYGKKHGYNFQHAENGGEYYISELAYFLDAYDVNNNVVLEIDEPHHYVNGELRKKDIIRQREITKLLGCKFIRKKI